MITENYLKGRPSIIYASAGPMFIYRTFAPALCFSVAMLPKHLFIDKNQRRLAYKRVEKQPWCP
jgi:hypothetical protein